MALPNTIMEVETENTFVATCVGRKFVLFLCSSIASVIIRGGGEHDKKLLELMFLLKEGKTMYMWNARIILYLKT